MTSLTVVIPAYNEVRRLPATLDRVLAWLDSQALEFREVIVVNDGSTDGTATLVESRRDASPGLRLLNNPGNRGKGYSVRHGMLEARGEWVLFSDADLSTPIEDAARLFAAATEARADIAVGSRAVDRSLVSVRQSPLREWSGRFFNVVMRAVTGLPFRDTQCGFKLYRASAAREVFSRQRLDGFSFDVEDLYIARLLGIPAIEVPVHWANVEGTKVSAFTGLRSFADLVRVIRGRR
ncbi:MAG: dolichyl-phosphate beta-glucosyltransferase [Bryobacteraceae bacterium]